MKRLILDKLKTWKTSPNRKPLIVYGARQIGKTYSILEFGKTEYDSVLHFNFEADDGLSKIFDGSLDPERIIEELMAYKSCTITKGSTLIFFDEIQVCERALTSLKYFNEQANDYHIIAAGSLLGVAVKHKGFSFPVGKVDMLNMFPLNFEEFLMATGNEILIEKIKNCYNTNFPLETYLHDKALELYRTYLIVGGYPAAVNAFISSKDFNLVRAEQTTISNAYIADTAKYTTPSEMVKCIAVYNSISSQLAKESTKFQYSVINSRARAKDYEIAMQWLTTAGVVLNCSLVTEGKYPVNIYENSSIFKLYYSDIGLLTNKMGLTPNSILYNKNIADKARGTLAESYVAEQFVSKGIPLHFWESGNTAEIDFVIQQNESAIPVEVKSADNVRAKSLSVFINKYSPKNSIKISTKNFGYENNIKSIPLYAVFCINDDR